MFKKPRNNTGWQDITGLFVGFHCLVDERVFGLDALLHLASRFLLCLVFWYDFMILVFELVYRDETESGKGRDEINEEMDGDRYRT